MCIGMILWNFVVKEDNFIGQVLTFTMLCTSLYSTYVWPGMLSMHKSNHPRLSVFICIGDLWNLNFDC